MPLSQVKRFPNRVSYAAVSLAFLICMQKGLRAQQEDGLGILSGVVTDPSGARVPRANLKILCGTIAHDIFSNTFGVFTLALPFGTCTVSTSAPGFANLSRQNIEIRPGRQLDLHLHLSLPVLIEELTISSDSTPAGGNGLVIQEESLRDFSDDQRILQQELLALAGGDAQHESAVYVDGFSNGYIPPKDTIREVRVNANSYSSQYDSYGLGRLEIFTKPGGEKLHGSLASLANQSAWNARNPYATAAPPYYALQLNGYLSGSFNANTSFFLSASNFNQRNNAVVNAVDGTGPISQVVFAPVVTDDYSARVDHQLNPNNTFTLRYAFTRDTQTNGGVGQLVLASEGFNNATTTQTLQAGNTQILSSRLVSETRFQYIRTRVQQDASSTQPTLIIQGSANGGGSPRGTLRDGQDHYEFQEYLSSARGNHFLRAGVRYRLNREANTSSANYNGEFIYCSLADYRANQPAQYSVTLGEAAARLLTGDVGLYAEDEWKTHTNLTLTYGLRFESQSAIPDHTDWAPRAALAWSVPGHDKKPPLAVIRGGFGLFYSPFDQQSLLTSVRENGISQHTFYGTTPATALAATATIYKVSPRLRQQYDIIGGIAIERSFGSRGRVSVDYSAVRGVHQFLSRNANAPLPGTYDNAIPLSGVRPLGGTGNVYQYASDGISKGRIVSLNVFMRPTQRLSLSTVYYYERAFSDAAGAASFTSNSDHIAQDYGRMAITPRHRLFATIGVNLPWSTHLGAMLNATSGTPFNITTGDDWNSDSIYNDRPAYATDMTRPSVLNTSYGKFDVAPSAAERLIPFNLATGPSFATMQMNLAKAFPVGPRVPLDPAAASKNPQPRQRPWELRLSLEADNVLNYTNPGLPIGVLSSPLFGKSISLAPGLSGNEAANRMLWLLGSFNF